MPIYIPPALAHQAAREVGAWHVAQERRDVAAQALALAEAELAKRTTAMRELARAIGLLSVVAAASASTAPRPPAAPPAARASTPAPAPTLPPPGITLGPPSLVPVPEGTVRAAGDEVAAMMAAGAAEYARAVEAGEIG